MKKLFIYTILITVLAACGNTTGQITDIPDAEPPEEPTPPVYLDIIANAGFDDEIDLQYYSLDNVYGKNDTITGQWKVLYGWGSGEVFRSEDQGIDGSSCIGLRCTGSSADIYLAQVIEGLEPEKAYLVSAKVKTNKISKGFGANISSGTGYCARSDYGVTGSTGVGWREVTFDIDEAPGGKALICLRLGYSGEDSDGYAYFDDVKITENTRVFTASGKYVKTMFQKELMTISSKHVDTWLGNLDKVYLAYKELFSGRVPWGGKKMRIRGMKSFPAWAWAGDPVLWNSDYISSELSEIATGSWSFGVMHEIGHNFASHIGNSNYSWNFNEELFANFRMYYAACKVPGLTFLQNVLGERKTYSGEEGGKRMFKTIYDDSIEKQVMGGDAIQYTLVRIVDKYGWQIFIDAFDFLYTLPRNASEENSWNNWKKFNYFLDALNKYVPEGEDVRSTYTPNDLYLIERELSN